VFLANASQYQLTSAACGIVGCCASGCDSYLQLTVAGYSTVQSSYLWDTEQPVWNQTLLTSVPESNLLTSFSGKLMDRNAPLGDWEICTFTPSLTKSLLAYGQLSMDCIHNGYVITKVTFQFQKN